MPFFFLKKVLPIIGIWCIVLPLSLVAQPIRINVIVPNPPPIYWEAYLEFEADILLILTNVSQQTQEIKLLPRLSSDRGLEANFRPAFQPLSPIVLAGGQSINLTYRDLRSIFGRPSQDDVQLSGISFDRLFESETIPEGNYTLCVEARDFNTNEPLSNNFGCALFFVQQHEPPLIIHPYDEAHILPLEPQFVNFLWSVCGIPGQTHYRFRLFDLDELGLSNPNDAFLLDAVRPYFEQDGLLANTLAYDLSLPPLIAGRHYALQVTAYDPAGQLLFAQNGQSQVHRFLYASPDIPAPDSPAVSITQTEGNPPSPPSTPPGNFSDTPPPVQTIQQFSCPPSAAPPLPNPYPASISPGMEIAIGDFTMEVLSGGGYSPISGTARILIPALNTYVHVSFSNLAVNTQLQAYGDNSVVNSSDGSGIVPPLMRYNLPEGNLGPEDLSENLAQQLADYVDNQNHWLNPTSIGNPPGLVNLPAGIAGLGMDLFFTAMEFRPSGATLSAFAKVELPEAQGNRRLILLGKGMCLQPATLGQGAALVLGNNPSFPLSSGLSLRFIGGEGHTQLNWTEAGIQSLQLDAQLIFEQSLIATGGSPLVASFTANIQDYQDWTASVSFNQNNWAIPGLNDFPLSLPPISAVYDHSALSSPAAINFPPSHPLASHPALWQGIYIPSLAFSFPQGIDADVEINHILLDAQGAWMDVATSGNLLPLNEGNIGGWPMAIQSLHLDVRGSSLYSGSFGGQLRLPISPQLLQFTAPLGADGQFSFAVALGSSLEVDMWVAELNLAGNSSISVSPQGNSYLPEAILHGTLDIGWEKADNLANSVVSRFQIPGIDFQNFTITGGPGQPQLSGQFGLDLEDVTQGALLGFPLQLKGVDIAVQGQEVGLKLDLGLKLTDMANGFEGNTNFTLFSTWQPGQQSFAYDRTQLNQISIDMEMGVLDLEGSISLYNNDPTFGDGFDGAITINIMPIEVGGFEMRLMVGRNPGYRYFMIDALLKFPGIPLGPSGLGLYGLGGGFYANMQRQYPANTVMTINDVPNTPNLGNELGQGGSGATYIPQQGYSGFMARTVIGLYPLKEALNADLEFGMNLGPEFNVISMYMSGDAYVMQNMTQRDGNALIKGSADLVMDFQKKEYTFGGNLTATVPRFLELSVPLEAFYSPSDWHFYLGRWTPGHPNPLTDPNRITYVAGFDFSVGYVETGINGYFMMGSDLPPGLPPKPLQIQNIFAENNQNLPSMGLQPFQTSTKGFAFGMINHFDLNFKALIFRLQVAYHMGLDVLLENKAGQECNMSQFGINQWYGKGQAYAYLGIEGAVEGKLFGKKRSFTFAEIEAAAAIDFAGPKPVWLRGKARLKGKALGGIVKFDTRIDFEHGKKVNCASDGNNIFDDIPIVEEFTPLDGATGQSIFTRPQIAFNFPKGAFPIEEASDNPGEYITRYYGYEITEFKVETKEQGGSWKIHPGGTGLAIYDEEGYSARYHLSEQLPENAQIRLTLRVRGQRYHSNNANQVAENFTIQTYSSTFQTGDAPDYILPNAIAQAKPFHRQLHFLEAEDGDGFLHFWHQQSNKLFRLSPTNKEGLPTSGSFTYVVQLKDISSGASIDVSPYNLNSAAGGGMRFPIPQPFLQTQRVYELDVFRVYTPPSTNQNNGSETEVVMADLGISNSPGGGSIGGLQIANIPQQNQASGGGGLYQLASFNTNSAATTNSQNQFATTAPPPGGGGPSTGGNGNFQVPGGNLDGLKYSSRKLKERGNPGQIIRKSILPQKLYFQTSRYNSLAEKMASVQVRQLASTAAQEHLIGTDALHQSPNGAYIKTPYIFLESIEGFDRFESQYWQWNYQVSDGENYQAYHLEKYSPFLSFEGKEDWRSQVFYHDGSNGLFCPPFSNSDNSWCNHTFYNPDEALASWENALPIPNAPLHSGGIGHTWQIYQAASPNYHRWEDSRRYRNQSPFGSRSNRHIAKPINGFPFDYQLPSIEFLQHPFGQLPSSLNGVSTRENHIFLTNALINAAQAPQPGGSLGGSVTLLATTPQSPALPSFVQTNSPLFSIGSHGAIQPSQGGHSSGSQTWSQSPAFTPLVDFTEWVTFRDYILFRKLLDQGVLELAEQSETMGYNAPALSSVNCSGPLLPLPNDPDFFGMNANLQNTAAYNFYEHYYKPIRAFFKANNYDNLFPYPARPAGEGFFKLGGKDFNYQAKSVNNQ